MPLVKNTLTGINYLEKINTDGDACSRTAIRSYNKQFGSQGFAGRTRFALPFSFEPGTHTLWVFVNGEKAVYEILPSNNRQYSEPSDKIVQFGGAMDSNDVLEFIVAGSYFGGDGTGGLEWSIISTNTTAELDNGYFVDTSSGPINVDLPEAATIGDRVRIVDYAGTFATNNCIIGRSNHNIMGLAEDFVCRSNNLELEFIYADEIQGWRLSDDGFQWSIVSASITAKTENGYFVNTSGGTRHITLPLVATIGDRIKIADYAGTFATTNCIIVRNGHNIMGQAQNFVCNIKDLGIEFVYIDTTQGWRVVSTTGGSGGLTWVRINSNVTALEYYGYLVDTRGGQVAITLPATPQTGAIVGVEDTESNFSIHNCVIYRNGKKIMGLSETLILDEKNQGIQLVYDGIDDWRITWATPLIANVTIV